MSPTIFSMTKRQNIIKFRFINTTSYYAIIENFPGRPVSSILSKFSMHMTRQITRDLIGN